MEKQNNDIHPISLFGDAKIVIYGAGVKGNALRIIFQKHSIDVIGYIDKNASNMHKNSDVPIYDLNDKKIEEMDKRNIVVVVSVANIFSHEAIISELRRHGFIYFLCKLNVFNPTAKEKIINNIFDNLYLYEVIDNKTIVPYIDVDTYRTSENIYDRKQKYIYCYIPLEMLFTIDSDYKENNLQLKDSPNVSRMVDKNVVSFIYCKKLYETFNNLSDDNSWEIYLRYYKDLKKECAKVEYLSEEIEDEDFFRHISERYEVYLKMNEAYNFNQQFFKENPVIANWNANGYFNIEDGANRVAFLMAKGLQWIPCKVKEDDYIKWENKSVVDDIMQKFQAHYVDLPIENPYFMFETKESIFYRQVSKLILGYLGENNVDLNGMNVYQLKAENGYVARQFARQRANMTISINEQYIFELEEMINELVYCKFAIETKTNVQSLSDQNIILNISREDKFSFDYSILRNDILYFYLAKENTEINFEYDMVGRCYFDCQIYNVVVNCMEKHG